jgi:hypothetical protein
VESWDSGNKKYFFFGFGRSLSTLVTRFSKSTIVGFLPSITGLILYFVLHRSLDLVSTVVCTRKVVRYAHHDHDLQ